MCKLYYYRILTCYPINSKTILWGNFEITPLKINFDEIYVMVGFLYGAGAETLIFVTGTSGKYPKLCVSRQKNQSQLWIPRKPRKIDVWVSGAEIQASAMDTRTAVWVSTAEKIFRIVLGETRNFSRSLGGSQHQLWIKTRPLLR